MKQDDTGHKKTEGDVLFDEGRTARASRRATQKQNKNTARRREKRRGWNEAEGTGGNRKAAKKGREDESNQERNEPLRVQCRKKKCRTIKLRRAGGRKRQTRSGAVCVCEDRPEFVYTER